MMKLSFNLLLFTMVGLSTSAFSQSVEEIKKKMDSLYQINITKTRINGVYIPATIEEACKELDALSPADALTKFRLADEEEVARKLHFGLGRWMKVNWNFEDGSRLSHILRGYGIHNPDDMVNFMLRTYHRYLNTKPLELKERAKVYEDAHKERVKKNLKEREVIQSETQKLKEIPASKGSGG